VPDRARLAGDGHGHPAAIDGVAPRLARDPALDVARHARELASLFVRAIRAEDGHPRETHEEPEQS